MRDLSLTISQPAFTKRTKAELPSAMALNLAVIALIVLCGFLYLFQVNALGTRGYEIRQLEQKIKVLQADNKDLQIHSSSLSSITKIQQEATALNMVPASNVTYIKATDFAMK
jgi:cell division protein FtsL